MFLPWRWRWALTGKGKDTLSTECTLEHRLARAGEKKKKKAAAGYFTLLPHTPLCKSLFPPQAGTGEPGQDPSTHHGPPQRAQSLHPTQPSPDRRGRGPAGCTGAVGRMMIPFAAWRLRGESAPTGFPSAFSSKAANYFSLGKLAFI